MRLGGGDANDGGGRVGVDTADGGGFAIVTENAVDGEENDEQGRHHVVHDQQRRHHDDHLQPEQSQQRHNRHCDENSEVDGANEWVASEVDPFLSAMREAILRERPVDVPAFASNFATRWTT